MEFRKSNQEIVQYFKDNQFSIKIDSFVYQGKQIRYIEHLEPKGDSVVLFIHGTPGGLDAFFPYLTDKNLRDKYTMISVDRLGYGYSNYGKSEISIKNQAMSLSPLFQKYPDKKWIVVGHSFGAPIAAYLGYLYPQQVKKVIMMGGAIDSSYEKNVWLAKIMSFKPFYSLLSGAWQVSTDEKLSHQNELDKIKKIWNNYPVSLVSVHGKKDWLVPYKNNELLIDNVPENKFSLLTLDREGHIFVFTNPNILKNLLLKPH